MKQFLTTVFLLVVIATAKSQSLQLTSPNGGEVWTGGSVHNITWTYTNVDNIKIEYSLNNGLTWIILSSSYSASSLSYSWTVPCIGSTQAKVRITNVLLYTQDESDNVFTIPQGVVDITYPNGGESFGAGTGQYIEWSSSGITTLKLQYTTNNGVSWTDIGDFSATNNYCNWVVPTNISTQACIRAYNIENPIDKDSSAANFNITAMPTANPDKFHGGSNDGYNMCSNLPDTIQVLSPNGGEVFSPTNTVSISWSYRHVDNINILYSTDNGASWNTIATNLPASQLSYIWTVPNNPSTQCLIKMASTLGNVYDVSNATFTIFSAQVHLVYPNGGEHFGAGTGQYVEWEQSSVSTVKLEYSTDNGNTWNLIGTSPAANLYANWVAPATISNQCKIRVSDNSTATVNDASDAAFSLYDIPTADPNKFHGGINDGYSMCESKKDSIHLLSPNGGSVFMAYTTQLITWEYNNIDNVKIEYSADNGNTWNIITNNVIASQLSYSWTVPSISSAFYLIKVSAVGKNVFDISDANFTVKTGFIHLLYPNGGEQFGVGTGQYIEWDYNAINTVKLEYSTDNGINWNLIGTAPAANKYMNWIMPAMSNTQSINCSNIFTTYGQGAWGAPPQGDNAGVYLAAHFSEAYPSGVKIGDCGRYLVFTSANAVNNFLPSGSSPRQLNNVSLTNPTSAQYSNVFAGHVLALNLNMTFDSVISNFSASASLLKNAKIATGIFSGWTVQQLYNEANRVIGCGATNAYLNSIKDAVEKVNQSYEEGSRRNDFLNCPTSGLLVRISDQDNPAFTDQSLSAFSSYTIPANDPNKFHGGENDGYSMCTFKDQYVKVIKPNGAEIWANGSTQKIKWKTLNTTENLKIEYTTDNEATWNLLQTNLPQVPDTFNWTISSLPSTLCKVRIKTMSDTIVDKSDDFFTIANPNGIVTNAVGGNTGTTGTTGENNSGTNLPENTINGVEFCSGETVQVAFTSGVTFSNNNHFIVQLSDSAGNFNESTTIIGDLMATVPQPITAVLPNKYEEYNRYRLRVVGTNPPTIGTDNGVDFTIKSLPKINLGNDTVICTGNAVVLNAGNESSSYLWSNGAVSNTINANTSGLYWVRVMNACGVNKDTIVITTMSAPDVNLGHNQILCQNNPITLNAGNEGSSYLWNNGSTSRQIAVVSAGQYAVVVSNKCGVDSASVIITSLPPLQVNLGEDKTMCQGATVYINAGNEGSSYLWSNGSTSQSIGITTPGTYSVKVNDGCNVVYDQINIFSSNAAQSITLNANNTLICSGQQVTLQASGGSSYEWFNGQANSVITVTPNATATYYVQGNNSNNCISSASVKISVLQHPQAPEYIYATPVTTDNFNGKVFRYTAPALSSNDSLTAASTGYQWSLISDPLNPSYVLDSGVLSGLNASVIRLRFLNEQSAISDSLKLSFTSTCGLGESNVIKLEYDDKVSLTVRAFLEGYYLNENSMKTLLYDLGLSSDVTAVDSVEVQLWSPQQLDSSAPGYQANAVLHQDGNLQLSLPFSMIGNAYYIALKHRNSIETWSSSPVMMDKTTSYDFTTGLSQAFGDDINASMKALGDGNYGLFGGDVNQDGTVDGSDMNIVDNNTSIAAFGYDNSDANGDGATDGLDMNIIDNNTQLGLYYARPR